MRTRFLPLGHRKGDMIEVAEVMILCRRMAQRTHYLPSGHLEMQVWWGRWSNVSWSERPCELIFCILGIQISDLGEFVELMFQVGEWPWEIIISLLDVLKCDCWRQLRDISSCRKVMRTHFLHTGHPKKCLWRSCGSDVSSRRRALRTQSAFRAS
jgi:hypothetical protein